MDNHRGGRKIDVLLFDDVNLLDAAGPVQAFEAANTHGRNRYQIQFVSIDGAPVRSGCGLRLVADDKLTSAARGADLLIPGGAGVDALIGNASLREIIQQRAKTEGRVISVCSGALILAAAGVLDGLEATTHWSREEDTRNYPNISWNLDRISITQGKVFTSAGVTTGIDLALSIIQVDCGPTVALSVARELVVQLRRTGGQSQYAFHLAGQFAKGETLTQLIEKVVAAPHLDWSLDALADAAGMNARTLTRRFKRDTNETPAQFVEKVRVDHARSLLSGILPLKQIAAESGFGDIQRMRRAFQRRLGVQLSEYRNMFT
ncbi:MULTISPECIES: GlxA family transcriptional regulator [Roseobacteraceae]|jgi:transcriptional regulator GlxA family with amidase domain|uniref:Isonitrile hydratase n=1 Tax=Pseudosulfitobacter pseudonitzschiae TaxID=1402135 RepID=A0A221K243_9RHOB|nr:MULTISPECIES: DJ-1/PfpI family protein [Roseobacteraceae]ASM73054.1 isonitrile hydratase [Pseudosulfitobacter pseudonitzschiae]